MQKEAGENIEETKKLNLLQQISLTVARAETIEEAYEQVLGHICRFMAWPLGHVYIWSEAADALVSSRVWYMADASTIAPFRLLSEETHFRRGEGTLGLVWESGEAISILDVREESVFVRQMPVKEEGIRAYFAFPIMVEGEVLAVLEFFSPNSVPPDKDITSLINHVSTLLALAMQRQETLRDLEQSKAQLDDAQSTAHVGHWEWDIIKNHVYWSPELFRIYGLSEETFTADFEGYIERVHPDDLEYVQGKIVQAYEKGIGYDYFHRIIRPDGVERVLHSRGMPVFDRAGTIIKLNGTAQDMTEQKEAESKLAHSLRQLSALIEIAQAVSATLELDQIYKIMLSSVRPLLEAEMALLFLEKNDFLELVAFDEIVEIAILGHKMPKDRGVAGSVFQSGQSELLKEQELKDRLASSSNSIYRPQAMLAVPIRWRDKTVGVLEATHSDPDAFEESDLRLLETAASWTAIAIANARQYQQLQRRLHESEAILAISNAMTEIYNLDELLQLIADRAQDIIAHADWTTIHLLDPKTRHLELAASAGLKINPDDFLINTGEGVAGKVIAEGGVINVPDLQVDRLRMPIDLRTHARALLSAPVETQRERIGTISVQCATPDIFTKDDEHLLTIFGIQAGMAIENARLYQVQQQAREKAEKQKVRMQRMAQRVVQAQEDERDRIARELHDQSGQSLTSLKIGLDLIRSMLPDDLAHIRESLGEIISLADSTMTELRHLSHNLRPPGLDAYGLDAALGGMCHDLTAHTSIKVNYTGEELPDLHGLTALSLYRFAQEAMTNAIKHGRANVINVTLSEESDKISLIVEDNGKGFTAPALSETVTNVGSGLLGMLERLEMVDGQMFVESVPGDGASLMAIVPYKREGS